MQHLYIILVIIAIYVALLSMHYFHLPGDTMCCFDCELMPKLQHIRVAGKFFVGYEIPKHLEHLWQYIGEMYKLDAFSQSCPADQVNWKWLESYCILPAPR